MKLYASVEGRETVIAEADCAAEGFEPIPTWVGYGLDTDNVRDYGLMRIEAIWEPDYQFPLSMPDKPPGQFFINNAPVEIGVALAGFSINAGGRTVGPYQCLSVSQDKPHPRPRCDVSRPWNDLNINSVVIRHNGTFTVEMTASLGGHKDGDPKYTDSGYNFKQFFTGDEATVRANFQFDTKPPSHCLLENTGGNCTVFPIAIDEDITTNPVINPKFLEWTDDGSGIGKYHVEVFELIQTYEGNRLEERKTPLATGDVTGDVNNFQFTATKPGVYSIHLTVYDRANNSARARKIFNFNDQESYETTDKPVYVSEADETTRSSELSFVRRLDNPRELNLNWPGRFQSDSKYASMFSMPVVGWLAAANSVDDQFAQKYGMRSTAAVQNLTGIASLSWAYVVDASTGGIGVEEPKDNTSWTTADNTKTVSARLTFDPPLADGDTVVIWLKAIGTVGSPSNARIRTMIDLTPATVSSAKFESRGIDEYRSTLVINVEDRQSGINGTSYEIRDQLSKQLVIKTGFVAAKQRDPPPAARPSTKKRDVLNTPCTAADNTCYCTPFRQCFTVQQVITIDHCDIDRFSGDGHKLEISYSVSNLAGAVTSENIVELGDISGLKCRRVGLSSGAIAGIVIACVFGLLIIILLIILIFVYRRRPAFKERVDKTVRRVRQRTIWRREEDNPVYVAAGPPPPAYNDVENKYQKHHHGARNEHELALQKPLSEKISRRQVQMQNVVGDGRFATIKRAQFDRGNGESDIVAAKALKNGFSPSDEQLMAKKILFLKKLAPHGNIVRFIGEVKDDGSGEGPIMLLELCEYTLKDWLASKQHIDSEDLETILGFTMNIARGVQHLHSCNVIHRRLAMRNVLLQQQANGLVAKLIGFGPTVEDVDEDATGGNVTVPVKWLAPETLDTLKNKKPTYNEKTDAWSYAVTIWETYSKGDPPYGNIRSADIWRKVKEGVRLERPPDCPPELYSTVMLPCWSDNASKRPKFSAIVQTIEQFRRGVDTQSGYYAANDDGPVYDNAS